MDRKDRNTLKSYFQKGNVPTEQQFAELIDSLANIKEDGQAVRTKEGWALYPQKDGQMCVRLYEAEGGTAAWTLALTSEKGLTVENEKGEILLELKQDKTIALYATIQKDGGCKPDPEDYREVKADKRWTNLIEISDEKGGNRVYVVIALYRDPNLGICKLTRATAIYLNSLEQWVESPRKHWWGWSGRVRLRWQAKDGHIYLQICSTKNSYSGKIDCRMMETFKK